MPIYLPERFPLLLGPDGKARFNYGKVIDIFVGAVWNFIIFFFFCGPEISLEERDEGADSSIFGETRRVRCEFSGNRAASIPEIGDMNDRRGVKQKKFSWTTLPRK